METKRVLNNTQIIPTIGLGVWRSGEDTKAAVLSALAAGYRHIDTAAIYRNEEAVGQAIKESGIPREEIFVTTKLWNEDMRQYRVQEAFAESLEKLQLDYVDLYLIHWPVANEYIPAYLEMEKIYVSGKAKSIGVSNFKKHHLEDLLTHDSVVPAIDQMEFNPQMQDYEVYDFCKEKGIVLEAYSPLGSGACLNHPAILKLAEDKNKSVAQIIIRWLLQKDIVPLPKSVHKNRIEENYEVYDFELSDEEMKMMNSLNINTRVSADPDTFDF